MNFLIQIPRKKRFDEVILIRNPARVDLNDSPHIRIFLIDSKKNESFIETNTNQFRFYFIGDPIFDQKPEEFMSNFSTEKIRYLRGFFYLIIVDKINKTLQVFNSIFSILPIYYYQTPKNFLISSRSDIIYKNINQKLTINKKFILEKTLFNYPLFNDTIFKEIKTVPSNSYIYIYSEFQLIKHTDISDFYVDNPRPWRKSVDELSDLFIETVLKYFPDERFFISFTGGFDGRTLVSVARKLKFFFTAFAYGSPDIDDIAIPKYQCRKLGIPFHSILLDDAYVKQHSLACALDLIEKTEGNAAFSRAHYVYAVKTLSKLTKYIITGNFGSELFRTIHNMTLTGLIFSKELFEIHRETDENRLIGYLKNSPKLKYLNLNRFNLAFEELIHDVLELRKKDHHLSTNRQFYIFVFEELFRKYFGPEIILQSEYLCNRSPYLDFKFIEFLLKTDLAGIYNKFFEENPLKRFKGQILYAHIIKKSDSEMLNYHTDKGYRPEDLLTNMGKFKIFRSFLKRRIFNIRNINKDPHSVKKSFLFNFGHWASFPISEDFFNKQILKEKFLERELIGDLNVFINILSSNYYINNLYSKLQ